MPNSTRLEAASVERLRQLVNPAAQANYRAMRVERDWTWEQMADDMERQAAPLPPEHASPYKLLADWARAEGDAAPSPREGTTPQPATPRSPKRNTRQQPPPRTA